MNTFLSRGNIMQNIKTYLNKWDLPPEYRVLCYSGAPVFKSTWSYRPLSPGYHDNILVRHTIDGISNRQYETDSANSIDEIFKDRKTLIRSKIELVLLQLSQRKSINQEIIKSINYDLCKTQTLLMETDYKNQDMGRNRLSLEQAKFDLERQNRMEQTSYFKDTGMLNRDLTDTLIQYIDHVQKDALMEGPEVEK
jgi:hypothetical protein